MNRFKFITIVGISLIVVGMSAFYACKKDPFQTGNRSKISQMTYSNSDFEQIRGYLCESMIALKNDVLYPYTQMGGFDPFLDALNVNRKALTFESINLLREIYEYCNHDDNYIRENYSGKGMAKAITGDYETAPEAVQAIMATIATNMIPSYAVGYTFFGVENSDYQNNPLGKQSEFILLNVLNEINNAGLVVQLVEFRKSSLLFGFDEESWSEYLISAADGAEYYNRHLEKMQAIHNQTGVDIILLAQMGIANDFDTYFADEMFSFDDTLLLINNMTTLSNFIEQTCTQIGSICPSFYGLSSEMKQFVLSEVWHHSNMQMKLDIHGGDPACFLTKEEERDQELLEAKIDLGIAFAGFILGAAGSGYTGGLSAVVGFGGLVWGSYRYCKAVNAAWAKYYANGGKESRGRDLCNI